jgi:membrane protein implicated in regulation of membrane protease activity
MIEEDTGVHVVQRPRENFDCTTAYAGEVLMNDALFVLCIALASAASFLLGICRGESCCLPRDNSRYNPVGKRAVVVEPVTACAPGRVRFQGSTWPARGLGESFRTGEAVAIAELDNTTLVIERWQCLDPQDASPCREDGQE